MSREFSPWKTRASGIRIPSFIKNSCRPFLELRVGNNGKFFARGRTNVRKNVFDLAFISLLLKLPLLNSRTTFPSNWQDFLTKFFLTEFIQIANRKSRLNVALSLIISIVFHKIVPNRLIIYGTLYDIPFDKLVTMIFVVILGVMGSIFIVINAFFCNRRIPLRWIKFFNEIGYLERKSIPLIVSNANDAFGKSRATMVGEERVRRRARSSSPFRP